MFAETELGRGIADMTVNDPAFLFGRYDAYGPFLLGGCQIIFNYLFIKC